LQAISVALLSIMFTPSVFTALSYAQELIVLLWFGVTVSNPASSKMPSFTPSSFSE